MAERFAASPSILNFMASSPNYGKLASFGAMENLKTEAQNLASNAGIHSAGMYGNDLVDGAEFDAVGIRAEGRARGHQAVMGGFKSGSRGLIGGISAKVGGGGGGGSGPEKSLDGYEYGDYGNLPGEIDDGDGADGYVFPSTSSWMTGG